LNTDAWTVCLGYEGNAEVCDRYAADLTRLAQTANAQNAVSVNDAVFASLLEILREGPAAFRSSSTGTIVFRFATLPAQALTLLRALRSFAESSWLPNAAIVRGGSVLYFALHANVKDESVAEQVGYFWNSVGSLLGKLDLHAAILSGPAEWKRRLNVWKYAGPDLDLHRRVKNAFDPANLFAPGRFVGGL
jgi:FAD/FMN-containing dehydrogenase